MKARTLLALLLALAAPAQAETRLDGALPDALGFYRIDLPDGWQPGGRLILYSHGFDLDTPSADDLPATAPDENTRLALLSQGYALAAGSYSSRGWALFDLERAQLALLDAMRTRAGAPGEIILFGGSLGGLVSLKTAEILHGNGTPAAGVLAACPPAGGARTWDQAVDVRLAFDAVCTGSPLPEGSAPLNWVLDYDDIPPDINDLNDPDALLQIGSVANRIRQCTGLFQPAVLDTDSQRARRAQLKTLIGLTSDDFLKLQLSYAVYPLADLIRGPDKLGDHNAFDNRGLSFGDPDIDSRLRRIARDPLAAVKLGAASDLTGRWGNTRVLAVHTDRDELVFPEHLAVLGSLRDQTARPAVSAVVREASPGHCGFTATELNVSLTALRRWIDRNETPSPQTLANACSALGASERCGFDPAYRIASLDSRIRPRALNLDQPGASHSGAWYDPDFDGEGLVVEVLPGGIDAAVTWYSYPAEGETDQQTWIAGLGRISADGIHVADAYRYRGARFGSFDPGDVSASRWGEFTLAFERCGDGSNGAFGLGRLRFSGSTGYGSGERRMVQLTGNAILPEHCTQFIQPQTPHPQSRYSGSWYRGGDAAGEGLQFQVDNAGRAVLVWYSYDPQGRPAWLIGTAASSIDDSTWRFTLSRPRGTRFGPGFDADAIQQPDWGTVELQFSGCDLGELRWTPSEPGWSAGRMNLARLTRPSGNAACSAGR